ncbi:MAG: MFS transporter [Gammaproteobacteria bacterium]|nr:MFS transporter [Gammaproteobacteria bacterium]
MPKKFFKLSQAWFVWGLAATFYFSDYLARVAPGVMHRELQADFGINEVGFTTLTAFFYIPYIIMQIPVGLTVDRIKIRYLLTSMSLITAVGCCVFAMSHGLYMASFARVLIGFSAAFAFISALRLATSWFPPEKLGLLAGLTQALGMLGASAGQAPLSFLVTAVGWRESMVIVSGIFIILAVLLFRFIQDNPVSTVVTQKLKQAAETSLSVWASLRRVLSNRQTWLNALYAGFLYAPTTVIGESMGPAYLAYGRGLTVHCAAFAVGLIFIGWVIGGPIFGHLSDKIGKRKPLMMLSGICGVIFTSAFVYFPFLSPFMVCVIFFLYGVTNNGVALAYAMSTELSQRVVIGTAIAFTNMMSIFVGAGLQPLVGFLVDRHAGTRGYHVDLLRLTDFQAGLWLLPIFSVIACSLVLTIKETHCKRIEA